jgi:hypothetical protein
MIRPAYSGTGYFAAETARAVGFGFDCFIGTQGRAVARNIFLDGNSFAPSRSVQKNYLVADLILGTELFYSTNFKMSATCVLRSSEFHHQGGWDKFASLNCSFEF